jgi:iron-sulfur cluster repair protein YtfE (RIC family)
MHDLELMHDDHSLLSSQVVHVVTLVKSLEEGSHIAATHFSEVLRQMEILRQELLEHFAFEEEEAFPRLDGEYPTIRPQLEQLQAQHARVLAAFEALRSVLWTEAKESRVAETSTSCDEFESVFKLHAATETALLRELATMTP